MNRFPGPDPGADIGIFFPRHALGVAQAQPTGVLEGILVLRDGCIWIETREQEALLALWPPGWVPVKVSERLVEIRDSTGMRFGEIGDQVKVGGGEIADQDHVSKLVGRDPPLACRGHKAWLVNSRSKPQ